MQEVLPPISEVLYPIYPEEPSGNRSRALWLLPSGLRSDNYFSVYVQAVQSFDWAEFYTQFKGEVYFDWLRAQLLSSGLADVVLIDSRTGITEMGGVCTRQLADVVVAFCVPNTQNVWHCLYGEIFFASGDTAGEEKSPSGSCCRACSP